ncbi:MAG: hypothetical protein ACLUKN_16495 [Bacilli bacterium]
MLQKSGDKLIIGKCTDIERLGPAVENPFLTSCGAIYNFEIAARAADILGIDAEYAAKLREAAAELRKTLPQTPEMYVPFSGCTEKSIVAIGGFFPYGVFDKTEKKQIAALYDVLKNIEAVGNMYPVGSSVCSWYAAWLASALVVAEMSGARLLANTARNTGQFSKLGKLTSPRCAARRGLQLLREIIFMREPNVGSPRENGDINVAASVPGAGANFPSACRFRRRLIGAKFRTENL